MTDYDTLAFRASWFKDQEDKLEAAADELACISADLLAIEYDWQESYRFAPFRDAYDEMRTALTSGPAGADEGVALLNDLRAGIADTGREYLRTEAQNAGIAREIETLIEQLDL